MTLAIIITNRYLRKLVWGIGFAFFCAILANLYTHTLKRKKLIVLKVGRHKQVLLPYAEVLLFLIITIFAAVRLNVGSDFYNYYIKFNSVSNTLHFSDLINADGYTWLSYIIKQFTDFEYAIFGVVAIVLYWYLFRLIKDEVNDVSSAFTCYLYLGFFANSLNILKQCIAMMLVMAFYRMLIDKKYVKCLICAFFSVLFHYTALFALIIIGLLSVVKIKPSRNFLVLSIVFGLMFAIFLPQLISLFIRLFPSASGYDVYVDWRRGTQYRLMIAVAGMSLIYGILLWMIVKNKNVIRSQNENRYYEIVFIIIGLCINIASIRIWVVQRVSLYFYQFVILVLPTMYQGMVPNLRKKTKQTLNLIMFVYLIFSGVFLGENEYNSYNTIFSGDRPIYDAEFNKVFK